MKKNLLIVVLLFMLSACDSRQVQQGDVFNIDDINGYIDNRRLNDSVHFSNEQWKELDRAYLDIKGRINVQSDNPFAEEKRTFDTLKGDFERRKAREIESLDTLKRGSKTLLLEVEKDVISEVSEKVEEAGVAIEEGLTEVAKQTAKLQKRGKVKKRESLLPDSVAHTN